MACIGDVQGALATWYDLSGVTLSEALSDRASFRRFYGFSRDEATPERTAVVRYDWAIMTVFFTLFDTAIGRCAIAWGARGIACVQLPEASETTTRARVLQRFFRAHEAAPPLEAGLARESIIAYLRGEPGDLSSVRLDMDLVPPFHRRVYEAARSIPRGATITYGDLAVRAGAAGSARAVGQALARNPFAIIVPCHRVVAAGGRIGGFTANGGATTKSRLLAIER